MKPEDGGQTATVKLKSDSVVIDNRWIVPYSPLLLKMFDAHINAECCNSIKSIKYILKYVHKGSDQGVFAAHSSNNCIDEISEYQAGRYISSNEAAWRIFGFPNHERYPTVIHLDMHLENGQRIYFSEDNLQCRLANPPNTTLTGFFELCKNDNFAKTLLYCNVPKFYTWDKSKKVFNRRKQGAIVEGHDDIRSGDALGRVYTVQSRNTDCYYLRLLLHKIKGPTSFKDLRTVNGIEYETYREACLALGLLENDNQWNEALKEAVYSDSPSKIRTLFALILSFCEPSSPKALWENNKDCMSEDILNKLRADNRHFVLNYTDSIYNEALIKIEDKVLQMIGKSLSEVGMLSPSRQHAHNMSREILREMSYDSDLLLNFVTQREPLLNTDQQAIYRKVLRLYRKSEGGVIFIDAPGGTGKTFLINVLLAKIRGERNIALAVATSGIAATLMIGGRTAHSMLQIPIDLPHNEMPVCNIKKGSAKAYVLQEAKVLFWDEISMMHKHGLEAVNRTLQDLRGNKDLMGGLIVVLAGDFQQTLPVIPRGTMADEIKACLKSSYLWKQISAEGWMSDYVATQSGPTEAVQWLQTDRKALHAHIIEATILTGPFEGEHVLIPRIPLIPTDLPFSFQRLQFPLRLAFAITINKAQGQSLRVTGLDLTDECFSHGQLYVGMSRAKDTSTLFIIADEQKETKNIVYSQVLK
ncbi:hypothetical protein AVEN_264514-1 [Araneus ventricosus]|uniref:ATP-dependent DNA helicase n=1 Tax=Araneus ventricosus TaxID=182803 RepID=A0A4Y2J8K9_ARAVE|nr:hypothetical protein AVEN_264514-1 [Araneus ventricosus]